jgi:predicted transcriptional regulator of viral defense system
MNLEKLQNIEKLWFNTVDIAKELNITQKSAQVTASRYVNSGKLFRLKRDMFILPHRLRLVSEDDFFTIANILQTPSYISLTSALSYFNLTTQQTRNYFESICIRRTKMFMVHDIEFHYTKVKKEFYFGFERNDNHFIASPEKALADSIYLSAIGKYNVDFDAIDLDKFDKRNIAAILMQTNKAAQNLWQQLIKNYKL